MQKAVRVPVMTLDKAQLECLKSPLRAEILSLLISDGPMSVTDLGRSTGYSKKSLYYPLRKLMACGLVHPGEVLLDGRRPEQLFDSAMAAMRLPKDDPATDALANEALVSAMSVALREVVRATESPQASDLDIVCHRTVAKLSEADRQELVRMLAAISDFVRDHTDLEAPAFSLTLALVPRLSAPRQKALG
jgi:DNA-binding transcriptional ArsR family regulator